MIFRHRRCALGGDPGMREECFVLILGRVVHELLEDPLEVGMRIEPVEEDHSMSNISSNSISAVVSGESDRGPLEPGLVSVTERVEVTFELIE